MTAAVTTFLASGTTPTSAQAYQLKISLDRMQPPVWRRVLLPATATLAELHDSDPGRDGVGREPPSRLHRGQAELRRPQLRGDYDDEEQLRLTRASRPAARSATDTTSATAGTTASTASTCSISSTARHIRCAWPEGATHPWRTGPMARSPPPSTETRSTVDWPGSTRPPTLLTDSSSARPRALRRGPRFGSRGRIRRTRGRAEPARALMRRPPPQPTIGCPNPQLEVGLRPTPPYSTSTERSSTPTTSTRWPCW